jgi:hypothetical protein
MTPALLEKISELVHNGATVVGLPPKQSPSLSGYPACDDDVKTLAQELWGDNNIPQTLETRTVGKGKVFWGEDLKTRSDRLYPHYDITAQVLSASVPPDFTSPGQIRYAHRTLPDADIYFVSNRTEQPVDAVCKFRIAGKQPELWHPVTGKITALPEYAETGGLTTISLKFDVYEGYFIVFRKQARKPAGVTNFPETKPLKTLDAPWTVSFDPQWGGPESTVFESLTDWTSHPDNGIKYYSGTAFYRQTFDMPDCEKGNTLYLNLGKVKNIARVRLNGNDLGTVWTAPWQVDISEAVKQQGNELEIEVVNLWPNRLIGDDQLSDDGVKDGHWPDWLLEGKPRTSGRRTFASFRHYSKDSPLFESGLLGPVSICESVYQ